MKEIKDEDGHLMIVAEKHETKSAQTSGIDYNNTLKQYRCPECLSYDLELQVWVAQGNHVTASCQKCRYMRNLIYFKIDFDKEFAKQNEIYIGYKKEIQKLNTLLNRIAEHSYSSLVEVVSDVNEQHRKLKGLIDLRASARLVALSKGMELNEKDYD